MTESLEWFYNFLYRFKSGFAHQVLRYKEDIFDVLWGRKSYTTSSEVLSLVLYILKDLDKIRYK
jgi:hypothetical protein